MGSCGRIIWLTGQPGTGKTTLAQELVFRGLVECIVDGDELRKILPNPGYGREGRDTNVDRAQAIAAWLASRGYNTVVAMVSPYAAKRTDFFDWLEDWGIEYLEVYLTRPKHTVPEERQQYWVEDYEPPIWERTELETNELEVEECVDIIWTELKRRRDGTEDEGSG
jgi:adenylylsulfate kinase-like enzyme